MDEKLKYCKHCGGKIPFDAVICTKCGRQVEYTAGIQSSGRPKNKWTAFFLCLFLGILGIHKFCVEKTGTGALYLSAPGLSGFDRLIDVISLLFKPNPYYV